MQPQLHATNDFFHNSRTIGEYDGITMNVAAEGLRFFVQDCAGIAQFVMNVCYNAIFSIGHAFVVIGELLENFVPQARSESGC